MYTFYSSSEEWPTHDLDALTDLVDNAQQILRNTFLRHVDQAELRELAHQCGYVEYPSQGPIMGRDDCVQYFKSTLEGETAYFFRWSDIDFVFTED